MRKHLFPLLLLVGYLFILIKVLVFKDVALIRIGELRLNFGGTQRGPANLIPFKSILPYLLGEKGFLIAFVNLLGNILALLPMGFLVPNIFSNFKWKQVFVLAVASGLVVESTQFFLAIGIFDIDDVILNGLGVIIGFGIFNLYTEFSKPIKKVLTRLSFTILVTLFSFYVITSYELIHLPWGLEPTINEQEQINSSINAANNNCCDLCNGTGGTGVITAIGKNYFNLERRDGKREIIKLTTQTTIKNSAGPATNADLKVGDKVTLVIDDTETASLVLICGIINKPSALLK
jgi:glycopeptide antibiotics resistance protein